MKIGDRVKLSFAGKRFTSFLKGRIEYIRKDGEVWVRLDNGYPIRVNPAKLRLIK